MPNLKVNVDLYTLSRRENLTSKALRCRSHSFTCKHTTPRSSPEGATHLPTKLHET